MALIRDRQNAERGKHGMFRTNDNGQITGDNGQPLAVFIDSFNTGLGVDTQSQTVILRLYHKDWRTPGGLVPREQVHQFALNAPRAAELGRQLLELAAQAEKERGAQSH